MLKEVEGGLVLVVSPCRYPGRNGLEVFVGK